MLNLSPVRDFSLEQPAKAKVHLKLLMGQLSRALYVSVRLSLLSLSLYLSLCEVSKFVFTFELHPWGRGMKIGRLMCCC